MLNPAVEFVQIVLAVHILAVVVAFGVIFAYPIIGAVVARTDPVPRRCGSASSTRSARA